MRPISSKTKWKSDVDLMLSVRITGNEHRMMMNWINNLWFGVLIIFLCEKGTDPHFVGPRSSALLLLKLPELGVEIVGLEVLSFIGIEVGDFAGFGECWCPLNFGTYVGQIIWLDSVFLKSSIARTRWSSQSWHRSRRCCHSSSSVCRWHLSWAWACRHWCLQ